MLRINIGCGQTPTTGWRNFDNSFSLHFSRIPFLPEILRKLCLIETAQYQFIKFAQKANIEYGDATKTLPVLNASCDVVYSSHMIEHLDGKGVTKFLQEVARVLKPGGVIRVVVPDIRKQIAEYNKTECADSFIEATHMCAPYPRTLLQRARLLLVGPRHHQWMYDGNSLVCLLNQHGFIDAEVMLPGKTKILDPRPLDLQERCAESVCVEARNSNEW